MKIALSVFPIYPEIQLALSKMKDCIIKAADHNCDLIIFPEACLTGLGISGNFIEDKEIGLSLDSLEIRSIIDCAQEFKIHIVFGLIELINNSLFDSALLIDDQGDILLHYRRIHRGWTYPHTDPKIYRCGTEVKFAETRLGKITLLICGDLGEPYIVDTISKSDADYIIYPFARAINTHSEIHSYWDLEMQDYYLKHWQELGKSILAVNAIDLDIPSRDEFYCGGAWIIDPSGKVIASKPILEEGLLIQELG
ncbi:MAG: carbon-nitrogen hydrolase family protein [Candidatus Cloacimonetes bacterium]|nr:carbon-nitrogen hydrolase family protein [Candidatus Cloacimonadota bacterium]